MAGQAYGPVVLLGWLVKLMVQLFCCCLRLPFFDKGSTSDWAHSNGHVFWFQIFCCCCCCINVPAEVHSIRDVPDLFAKDFYKTCGVPLSPTSSNFES